MIPLDKYGWPVEQIIGRPVTNYIRNLLHAKSWVTEDEWRKREESRNAALAGSVGSQVSMKSGG